MAGGTTPATPAGGPPTPNTMPLSRQPTPAAPSPQLTAPSAAPASLAFVSQDRLAPYMHAANNDQGWAWDLYVWNRDLSVAFLADIAILEVALRNALSDQLTAVFGTTWYATEMGIDFRCQSALAKAWRDLPAHRQKPGWLVSQLMFGFWTGLLDAGGYVGKEPQRFKVNHEGLWRKGLSNAFPGGKVEAAATKSQFTRATTHKTVNIVNAVRNRAAHHEPFLSGFPLPGQRTQRGTQPIRLTALDGHNECMKLARLLDRNLARWITGNTQVPKLLATRPTAPSPTTTSNP